MQLLSKLETGLSRLRAMCRGARKIRAETDDRLAEISGCLALRFNLSGQVSSVSSNCERLFGMTPGALMERGFFDRVQVADRPAFLQAISDASAEPLTATATLRWRGAEHVAEENCIGPVFHWLEMRALRSGEFVVALFRDVTEEKQRDTELETARANVLEANSAKEHFLAHASHEIRAPLNAIAGFAELLAGHGEAEIEPGKQREYARIIHQSGQHLLSVVTSVTDMSLIQSGKIAIALESFDAAQQIDLCCDMAGLKARNSGVLLLRAYPANLGQINCDRRLFTQILINLITNAIKFTPTCGRVTITARAEPSSLLIKVTDTGIGIDAEDLGRLGAPFFQAKGANLRPEKGTGLGLAIVRGFVGLLGGEIMVASEPAKGTVVRLRLPLDSAALTSPTTEPAKIATIARLPLPEESVATRKIRVKKIA